MPFATTTTPPATNAKVTIKFAGLMILKPGADDSCEIGIHRFSSYHSFQVMVVVCKPKRPPTLIRLVSGALTRPLAINVRNPGRKVQVFTPTAEPFDRNSAANHVLDFRWAINLREMHENVDFNDGARPIATLNSGTLYSPNLIPAESPDLVQGNGSTGHRIQLHRFAADLAASLKIGAGNTVTLSWDELGEPRSFIMPRRSDPRGTRYTVSLMNDPPISNAEPHDEMRLYYKVLEVGGAAIGEDRQFRFAAPTISEPSTDEIPCMPVVLNPQN